MSEILNAQSIHLTRELKRSGGERDNYRACQAQQQALQRHLPCRPKRKLIPSSALFEMVASLIKNYYLLEQIEGTTRALGDSFQKFYDMALLGQQLGNSTTALFSRSRRRTPLRPCRRGLPIEQSPLSRTIKELEENPAYA